MSVKKKIGQVFLLIGLFILILASSADFIGFGEYPGYGYKQISGLIVGAVAIIVGVYFKRQE